MTVLFLSVLVLPNRVVSSVPTALPARSRTDGVPFASGPLSGYFSFSLGEDGSLDDVLE